MRTRTSPLAAAGLTAAAALLGAVTGPAAQADVTGGNLTVVGNAFQVFTLYNSAVYDVTTPIPAAYPNFDAWGYGYILDTIDGVTVTTGSNMGADTLAHQLVGGWEPATAGTHSITTFVTNASPAWGVPSFMPTAPLPDSPPVTYGPATVTVTGTPTTATAGYTACSTGHALCITVKGTPQVGCTLTVTTTPWYQSSMGSATSPSEAEVRAQSESDRIIDNGAPLTTISPRTGQADYTWTPTTTGMHHLSGTATWNDLAETSLLDSLELEPRPISGLPTGIGPSLSAPLGDMWMPIAPAGTSTCA